VKQRVASLPDIRDRILDAAESLLAQYGYRKMTVEDIAREVGIGKGTIYLHFNGKQELALSTVDRIVKRLVERLREIAAMEAPATERLQSMLEMRVLFRFDRVRKYSQGLDDLLRSIRSALLERREHHFELEAGEFERVLEEGLNRGELSLEDARQTAHLLLIATNSLLPFNLSPRELGDRADLHRRAKLVSELLIQGLEAQSAD
jgi:AcrR family transcriptional regulator